MAIKKCRFVRMEEDTIIIEFPSDGSQVFAQKITKPGVKELIERHMSDVFGRPVHIQAAAPAQAKRTSQPAAGGKKNLEQVYEAFPREKIEIIDD